MKDHFHTFEIDDVEFIVGYKVVSFWYDRGMKKMRTGGTYYKYGPPVRFVGDGCMVQTDNMFSWNIHNYCTNGLHFFGRRDEAKCELFYLSSAFNIDLVVARRDETVIPIDVRDVSYDYARAMRLLYVPSLKVAKKKIEEERHLMGRCRIKKENIYGR